MNKLLSSIAAWGHPAEDKKPIRLGLRKSQKVREGLRQLELESKLYHGHWQKAHNRAEKQEAALKISEEKVDKLRVNNEALRVFARRLYERWLLTAKMTDPTERQFILDACYLEIDLLGQQKDTL